MIVLSVMFPNIDGARFDEAYYLETHLPLIRRKLRGALKDLRVMRGLAGAEPGSAAAYLMVAQLGFETADALGTAIGTHGSALFADIANFTDIEPVAQVSEVLE